MALATATQFLALPNEPASLECTEKVGIENLPDQKVRHFSKCSNGYCFNLMVLGESCCGKATLVESLFGEPSKDDPSDGVTGHGHPSVTVSSKRKIVEEGGVKVNISVAVSSGLGDQLDKTQSASSAVDLIESLFAQELEEELKAERDHTRLDKLVHACVYLLSPTGRDMKELDLLMMKMLHERVHLIPVIGKADSITPDELLSFKASVRKTLDDNKIQTYKPFSTQAEEKYTESFPLAVVASTDFAVVNEKRVRAREYPWGLVEVENPEHSQLGQLRNLLLRDETYYMMKTTKEWMYARYREKQLAKMGFIDHDNEGNAVGLLENLAAKKQETLGESGRREKELRQRFLVQANKESERLEKAKAGLIEKFDQLKAIHKKELEELKKQDQILQAQKAAWVAEKEAAATKTAKKGRSRLGTLTRKASPGDV